MSFFQALLEDAGTDLFLAIGDSTSGAGTNDNTGPGPTPTTGTAYYYRRSNNTVIPIGANDLEFASDPPADGCQWPQFCVDYYSKLKRKAVIIPSGVAGATYAPNGNNNNWSSSGDNYALAVSDAQATMTITGIEKLRAIFICCGINDANNAVSLATVESDLNSLVTRLTADFPNTDIVFCQIGTSGANFTTARIASIRKYIKNACENNTHCYIIGGFLSARSLGLYIADGIHLNQTGQNLIGSNYARWCHNRNYRKWGRSIMSSFHIDLSEPRKLLIAPIDDLLTDYFNHELLQVYVTPSEGSAYQDWTFTCVFNNGISGAVQIMGYTTDDNIDANGINESARPGYAQNLSGFEATQNDVFHAVKFKVVTTAAGTFATAYGGLNAGTIGVFLAQTNTNTIRYRVNDITNTEYTTDTKLQNDTEYLIARDGGTKYLFKNGSQVHSASVASTGVFDTSPNLSSNNNNGAANSWIEASYQWCRAGKHVGTNQSAFYAYLENIVDHWND